MIQMEIYKEKVIIQLKQIVDNSIQWINLVQSIIIIEL